MKRWLFIACLATLVLPGCQEKKEQNPVAQNYAQNDSLEKIIAQKDNELNDMMGTLNEIQEGFREINEAEGRVTLARDGEKANKTQQIRENIQFIAKRMERNRDLIAKLRQQLRESSIKGDALKTTIDDLTKQLEEKDQQLQQLRAELDAKDIHISELDETINNLNSNVSNLKTESSRKTQTINNQDKQLNTAWYVFGTKKELRDQRIMEKNRVLQGNFNKNYFTKIDIRDTKEIKLYSRWAEIKTQHPGSSYTLERDANKLYVLRITNPQLFWSTSKYLVILVK